MKIVSFVRGGAACYGKLVDGRVYPASASILMAYPDLKSAIAAGALARLEREHEREGAALADIEFLPTIHNAEKYICVGLNYKAHAAELNMKLPSKPSLFIRLTSSIVCHGGQLEAPSNSVEFDYEGELAIVIGLAMRHVGRGAAMRGVAGYTCFNDGSVRDYQGYSVTAGKNFPRSGALGPYLVTPAEVGNPDNLNLLTKVNGTVLQASSTSDMIFDVAAIISYASEIFELKPGDVIATGTPAGVGWSKTPRGWLSHGDTVEVDIEGLGTLSNRVSRS